MTAGPRARDSHWSVNLEETRSPHPVWTNVASGDCFLSGTHGCILSYRAVSALKLHRLNGATSLVKELFIEHLLVPDTVCGDGQ